MQLRVACGVLLTLVPLGSWAGPNWVTWRDLDGDGAAERITFNPQAAYAVTVRSSDGRRGHAVPKRWQPWKAMLADADGNGRMEIAVGVDKSTRYIPRRHRCLFLYRWRRGSLEPVWLGSALSRPFSDFAFALPLNGRAWPLYAVEATPTGKQALAEYAWNGFGFTLKERRGEWRTARILAAGRNDLTLSADGRTMRVPRRPGQSATRKEVFKR